MKQRVQNKKSAPSTLWRISLWAYLLIGTLFSACDDSLDTWNEAQQNTAAVEFYSLSSTFPYYDAPQEGYHIKSGIGIFVDTTEYRTSINSSLSRIPYLPISESESRFPSNNTNGSNNQPLYMNYAAGSHSFIFSYFGFTPYGSSQYINDLPASRLADTTLAFETGSRNTLYFTDDVAEEGDIVSYRIVPVRNYRSESVTEGKVSVRFIHLGVDAGELSVKLVKNDGEEITAGLPQQLNFTGASDYTAIDTEDVVQDGIISFRIYTTGADVPLVLAGVPAQTGHSFDILLYGFTKPHTWQVIARIDEDGTLTYKTVELPAGFTATVRQMY